MAQHIRNKPEERIRQIPNGPEPFKHMLSSQMQRIRSSPKMMMGTIFMILLMIILIIVAVHYFRLYSFPFLSFIPQKPAPASHLQYFFF
jgi:cell division protein FtsL